MGFWQWLKKTFWTGEDEQTTLQEVKELHDDIEEMKVKEAASEEDKNGQS